MVRPESNEFGDFSSDNPSSIGVIIDGAKTNNEINVGEQRQSSDGGDSPHEFDDMPMLGEGDSTPRGVFADPSTSQRDNNDREIFPSGGQDPRSSARPAAATHSESRSSFFSKPYQRHVSFDEGSSSSGGNRTARRFASDYGIASSSSYQECGAGGQRRITSNDEPKPNLIVNYLPQNFSDKEFFNLFAPYGVMESIKIMRDSQTGYSFGYGFVNYIDLQDAIDARNELNGRTVGHKRIKVSFARPPSDDIKDTNLFVTGLSTNITEEELDQMFSPFGVIVHLRVLRDRQTKATRGVAFVRYETRSEACTAILEMNGVVPRGANEPIRVRLAQDHGKQKAAYLAGYQAALKMKGGVGLRVPEVPYRHSESAFNLRSRNQMPQNRGRPLTACVSDGIRITTSSSDPTLYWKGFLQGAREPRRAETSAGRGSTDRRTNSRASDSHRY